MSKITTVFLGKEYPIPTDVITYVGLVDFTNGIRDSLVSAFKRKVWPNVEALESENFMVSEINDQVSNFIRKLLENDIYDRTTSDYLNNSKGYGLFLDTKKKALRQIISIRKEKLDTYRAGVEGAIYRKESSVTGLDFGIISSSFVNHMIYAYMDASKQTKQEQEALQTYNREIAELDKQAAEFDRQENSYIFDNVIPAMNTVFTYFAYELLDKYVSDLIRAGKFDKAALGFINLERSNELLKNLELSSNRTAIIESAFEACPFNLAVYMQAMKYDLLDYESFQAAKLLKQGEAILSFLRDGLRDPKDHNKMYFNLQSIKLLSLYTDSTMREVTADIANFVVKAYSDTFALLTNKKTLQFIINKADESDIIKSNRISKEQAQLYVNSIASANLWDKLVNVCGHSNLLNRVVVLLPKEVSLNSKEEIDAYLKDKLYEAFESTRQQLASRIIEKKVQEDAARQKAEELKQKKRIMTTVICSVVALLIIIAVSLPSIIENGKISKREAFLEEKIQEVVLPLEKEMEDTINADVTIEYSFSLEDDWDDEQRYEWTFAVRMPMLEDYQKTGNNNQELLVIMDACRTINEIYEDVYDDLDLDFKYEDIRIKLEYRGGNMGALKIQNMSSSETFYYEEYSRKRYLHSFDTEYVVNDD